MIVGEALNRRADIQKRVVHLENRLEACALVEEHQEPPERPDELLVEAESLCDELQRLIARINRTNATVEIPTGETVTEALARRDVLARRRKVLSSVVSAATDRHSGLFGPRRSEVRMVRQVDVGEMQSRIDSLAKERRELDTLLQQHNWTTSLVE